MTPDTEFADTFSGGDRAAFVYRHMVSFQETNLVGNVYFAHLAAWQGRCRELFLMRHAPEVLTDLTKDFKMVTTSLRIDYVLELFAFDEVEIRMRLAALNGHRISMDFEYAVEREGLSFIAAQGSQDVACLIAGQPAPPPPGLLAALHRFGTGLG